MFWCPGLSGLKTKDSRQFLSSAIPHQFYQFYLVTLQENVVYRDYRLYQGQTLLNRLVYLKWTSILIYHIIFTRSCAQYCCHCAPPKSSSKTVFLQLALTTGSSCQKRKLLRGICSLVLYHGCWSGIRTHRVLQNGTRFLRCCQITRCARQLNHQGLCDL